MNTTKRWVILILLTAVLLLLAAYLLLSHLRPALLNEPESIAFNAQSGCFLISNAGSGQILSQDDRGNLTVFASGLDSPRGIKAVDGSLWVADGNSLKALDLKTGSPQARVPVTGAIMLNDIESDTNGRLFVTHTKAHRIFVHDPAAGKTESLSSPLLKAPNGIVFDASGNRMLVVSFAQRSPLLSLDLATGTFSVLKTTSHDDLDGIVIDSQGWIYYSSWGGKAIYKLSPDGAEATLWRADLRSPAEIYYHQGSNEILVPLFEQNEIRRFPLD